VNLDADLRQRHVLVKGCGKATAADSTTKEEDASMKAESMSDDAEESPTANGHP
jgi:hypothetical protein